MFNVCSKPVDDSYPLKAKYPMNLMVEVTNACNLKCIMCTNRLMKRPKGYMSMETYGTVLDNAKEIGIKMVGLYTTGESFLHYHIFDFIKLAKEKGFGYVYITTNGVLLDKGKIGRIFESGLDSIKFSIDSTSKEVYEKLRPGGNFDLLYKNIKMLREERDERKSKLKIYGSFVLTNENYSELKEVKKFWGGIIDEMLISVATNQSGHQDQEFVELVPERIRKRMASMHSEKRFCDLLWNRIIVTFDGKYTICSEDFEGELIYGNIKEESMAKAWNNEKMQALRRSFADGNFEKNPQCKGCLSNLDESDIILEELAKGESK